MECIFCKIINGDIPSYKIYEDDNYIIILDAFPSNEGHSLIIPKNHYKNILDIDNEIMAGAYSLAKKTALAIKEHMGIKDINIIQNNGELAGQSVDHFHIHVLPRHKDDSVVIKAKTIIIDDIKKENIRQEIKKAFDKNKHK